MAQTDEVFWIREVCDADQRAKADRLACETCGRDDGVIGKEAL